MKQSNISILSRNVTKSVFDKKKDIIGYSIILILILATALASTIVYGGVATAEGTNLALNKSVTASETLNVATTWQLSNLTDGKTEATGGYSSNSRRASENNVTISVGIDLGSSLPFSKVVLFPRTDESAYDGGACNFPKDFEVQASNNSDFSDAVTTLASKTGVKTTREEPVTITFSQVTFRYIRLHVTKLGDCETEGGDNYVQLAEIEVYNLNIQDEDRKKANAVSEQINALPGLDSITLDNKASIVSARGAYSKLTDTQKTLVSLTTLNKLVDAEAKIYNLEVTNFVNISLGKKVTGDAISGDQWKTANLTDGDKNNCFSSNQWLPQNSTVDAFVIDLGVSIPVSRVIMFPRTIALSTAGTACNFPENFTIQASETADFSGKVTALITKTGITTTNTKAVTVDFPEFTTRYLRLHVTKLGINENAGGSCVQLSEFEVYSAADQETIDAAVAIGVNLKLSALPVIITAEDSYTVFVAKSMYDNLTPSQKLLIDDVNVAKIMSAEAALIVAVYDKGEVRIVTLLINKIPSTVTKSNTYVVNAAKAAYSALSDTQKSYMSTTDTTKLNKAIADLTTLKN